ncbi:hypothetical protein LNL84_04340 [Vibrio sp. ZSDZ34]|uniref:Uncharacterized protein n=1 Tax=Vibrio gelatinilyticus TaxID=2893468 RepID=A0A9X1W872_9VIBR|nr:hypothetical protein [Vibrio gelatinilyticus]MCJ2376057.1 hypothetical protein [Vibrio gelatinilyticus]
MNTCTSNTPFLMKFAVPRSASPSIGGYYCERRNMWVDEDSDTPMIELGAIAELSTKTDSVREADDEISLSNEIQTKTFAQTESDDSSTHCMHLIELMTKTKVELESDDTGPDF